MAHTIKAKIVKYEVLPSNGNAQPTKITMHESLQRPEALAGSTYKIKTPDSEHALYITINDITLNLGTEHEERRPYEIFINSKNMEHFQWVLALTRVISAVFRKGGDVIFLVKELQEVFDPRGGYFKKGGGYMPSLVAEIGGAIEQHMHSIGMIEPATMSKAQKEMLLAADISPNNEDGSGFPEQSTLCYKCNTKAVVSLDNCLTCLNCGDSKCQ